MKPQWAAGMDVGKHQDHTSLALITWTEEYRSYLNQRRDYLPDGRKRGSPHLWRLDGEDALWREMEPQERYVLKWLKNLPLGRSYTWQASAVVEDVLQYNHRIPLRRVVIHGGRNEFYDEDKREWHVPRNALIMDLQVALEEPGRTLLIDEAVTNREQLIEEASNLKPDIPAAGRERIGFFKEEVHDDRVFAFAMAYWLARKVLLQPRLEHSTQRSTKHLPYKPPAEMPFKLEGGTPFSPRGFFGLVKLSTARGGGHIERCGRGHFALLRRPCATLSPGPLCEGWAGGSSSSKIEDGR